MNEDLAGIFAFKNQDPIIIKSDFWHYQFRNVHSMTVC